MFFYIFYIFYFFFVLLLGFQLAIFKTFRLFDVIGLFDDILAEKLSLLVAEEGVLIIAEFSCRKPNTDISFVATRNAIRVSHFAFATCVSLLVFRYVCFATCVSLRVLCEL